MDELRAVVAKVLDREVAKVLDREVAKVHEGREARRSRRNPAAPAIFACFALRPQALRRLRGFVFQTPPAYSPRNPSNVAASKITAGF
ncbi:MAG: hypothetical protein WAW20_09630 [Anaerolineae bacterium]|nr:hypothetical protein [Anaerolineae bacterium]